MRFHELTLRLGIVDILRDAVDEFLERVRALDAEKAAAVAVGVDVGDGVRLSSSACGFGPLGGAEQPGLLAVPGGVDDRALRPPALLVRARRARALPRARRRGRRSDPRAPFTQAS